MVQKARESERGGREKKRKLRSTNKKTGRRGTRLQNYKRNEAKKKSKLNRLKGKRKKEKGNNERKKRGWIVCRDGGREEEEEGDKVKEGRRGKALLFLLDPSILIQLHGYDVLDWIGLNLQENTHNICIHRLFVLVPTLNHSSHCLHA